MIASGICLMGGCFAQNEDASMADAYWPCASIPIPVYAASVGIYQLDVVPAGVRLDECKVFTRQKILSGYASFFYVLQNNVAVYNAYSSIPSGSNVTRLDLQYTDAGGTHTIRDNKEWSYPLMVDFQVMAEGASVWGNGECFLSSPKANWNAGKNGGPLRILDGRSGEKEFYVSCGTWGIRWCVIPMRSPLKTDAVFDIETKTLVEI